MWNPSGPYKIQSGKKAGKFLEQLMFSDYRKLGWQLGRMNRELIPGSTPNSYHRHLRWLMERGESRRSRMICGQCHIASIELYSIRYSATGECSFSPYYTCCSSEECQSKLKAQALTNRVSIRRIKFSEIPTFDKKYDQKSFGEMLRWAYDLPMPPNRLTADIAFAMFTEDYT